MVFSSSGAGSTDRLEVDAAHENRICPGITKNRPGNNRAKSLGYERYESPLDNARIARADS
jgi:hypothetical protein